MENQIRYLNCLLNLRLILTITVLVFNVCFIRSVLGQVIDDDTVDLVQGTLRGSSRILDGRRVYYFLGAPYAEPPLNNRRFRPSSPHNGWTVNFNRIFYIPSQQLNLPNSTPYTRTL